ncbi:MAG TPA: M28 family peptidase [Thermoanaerobaculia bacterium]|nr:M28 family peptidase [Thermoanaerobaculia bacterium]
MAGNPAPDAAPAGGDRRLTVENRLGVRRLSVLAVLTLVSGVGMAAGAAAPSPSPSSSSLLPDAIRERAAALRDDALAGTRALEIARSLTFEVGPRSAGSPGDRAGVEWGLRTLRGLGFENVHAEKVTVPHWDRGTIAGEIVSPWPQPVILAALGGSVGTPDAAGAGGIEAEVVGVPSLAVLEQLDPARVQGKIVFYDVKMERTKDIAGYRDAVPVRGAGASRAARRGAVAVLIRSIGTGHDRFPHTGAMRYEEGVAKIPAAALASADADLLAAALASGKPVRFRLRSTARMLPDEESANVIGDIRGRERPDEIVLLGAHLDSWDLGTGGIDDGAGVAIMTEAARRIGAGGIGGTKMPRPRRTIRVVLFANEEFGTSGGRAYAQAHAAELTKHVMAAESDLGAGRVYRLSSGVLPDHLPQIAELAQLVAPLGVAPGDNEARGGSDVGPLGAAGVPLLDLDQDATLYFDWHHTANDTVDKIDPKEIDQNVAAWAALAYAVAEMPGDLGRAPAGKGRE